MHHYIFTYIIKKIYVYARNIIKKIFVYARDIYKSSSFPRDIKTTRYKY